MFFQIWNSYKYLTQCVYDDKKIVNKQKHLFFPVGLILVFGNVLASVQIFHAIPSSFYSKHKRRAVGEKNRLKESSGQQVQKHAAFAPARQKLLGFRFRSHKIGDCPFCIYRDCPLFCEPCPLCLQTVFFTYWPSQN